MTPGRGDGLARGIRALAGREALGIALSILAVPVVLRAVGPIGFGIFSAALVLSSYVARLAAFGLDLYLSRYPGEIPAGLAPRLLAIVAAGAGIVAAGIAVLAGPLAVGLGVPEASDALRALALFVWVAAIVRVPIALLEHRLAFRSIARIELAALAAYYGVTLPSVLLGAGYWGIVVGTLAQAGATATLAFWLSPIALARPAFGADVRAALRYAVGAQASIWVWSLRDLVAPVVVGHALGVREVGVVAAAVLLVNRISFLRMAVWRVSIPALAKIQDDPRRLRNAITRGTAFQAVVLGGILLGFAACAPWLVPLVLGTRWSEASKLVSLLAIGVLANAIYTLHSSTLLGRGRLRTMTAFHLLHVGTLAVAAVAFVPRWGLLGYGGAEICALWAYAVPHLALRRSIGESISRPTVLITLAVVAALAATALLGPTLGALAALATGAALLAASRSVRLVIADTFSAAGLRGRDAGAVEPRVAA